MTTVTFYNLNFITSVKYAAYFIVMFHACRWNNPDILEPFLNQFNKTSWKSFLYYFKNMSKYLKSLKQDCSHSLSFSFSPFIPLPFSIRFTTLFLQLNIISHRIVGNRQASSYLRCETDSVLKVPDSFSFFFSKPTARPSSVRMGHRETGASYHSFNAFDLTLRPLLCLNLRLWSEASFLLPLPHQ